MTASETSPSEPSTRASRPDRDRTARVLAILAIAGALAAGWAVVDARMAVRSSEAAAATRLAELGSEAQEARAQVARTEAALREAEARIDQLEARVADTHEQRIALEEMYRELSRSADDRILSEVEQMLVLASQQLQLAGNVRAALAALQAADQRLARAEKLAGSPLRRAIGQDIDRLKAVPQADVSGMALRIDQVIAQTDTLPLVVSESMAPMRRPRSRPDDESGFVRFARDLWHEMKGLVRIRDLQTEEAALIAPTQAYFLRENLKLRLLAARMALLAREEGAFRQDLRASQALIERYFDTTAQATSAALATLKQVADAPVTVAVPDINASLAAVRTARAARDKR